VVVGVVDAVGSMASISSSMLQRGTTGTALVTYNVPQLSLANHQRIGVMSANWLRLCSSANLL